MWRPPVEALESCERVETSGHRCQLARVHAVVDDLAFLSHAPVVIDAEVAADADDPRGEVGPAVERAERLEDLQKDVLRQILGLVVATHERVRDVEHLPAVAADDGVPRRLVSPQAGLVEGVGGVGRAGQRIGGHKP